VVRLNFIETTNEYGIDEIININHITRAWRQTGDKTSFMLVDQRIGEFSTVKVNFDEFKLMLSDHIVGWGGTNGSV
jgi:hypothetical protein